MSDSCEQGVEGYTEGVLRGEGGRGGTRRGEEGVRSQTRAGIAQARAATQFSVSGPQSGFPPALRSGQGRARAPNLRVSADAT